MSEFLGKSIKLAKAIGGILAYPAVSYPAAFVAGGKLYDPVLSLAADLIGKVIGK